MLQLSLADGILIYSLIWLLVIFYLWHRELRRAALADWELNQSRLFNCDNCHHSFIAKDMRNVTRCPRCNGMCIYRKHN